MCSLRRTATGIAVMTHQTNASVANSSDHTVGLLSTYRMKTWSTRTALTSVIATPETTNSARSAPDRTPRTARAALTGPSPA